MRSRNGIHYIPAEDRGLEVKWLAAVPEAGGRMEDVRDWCDSVISSSSWDSNT